MKKILPFKPIFKINNDRITFPSKQEIFFCEFISSLLVFIPGDICQFENPGICSSLWLHEIHLQFVGSLLEFSGLLVVLGVLPGKLQCDSSGTELCIHQTAVYPNYEPRKKKLRKYLFNLSFI